MVINLLKITSNVSSINLFFTFFNAIRFRKINMLNSPSCNDIFEGFSRLSFGLMYCRQSSSRLLKRRENVYRLKSQIHATSQKMPIFHYTINDFAKHQLPLPSLSGNKLCKYVFDIIHIFHDDHLHCHYDRQRVPRKVWKMVL